MKKPLVTIVIATRDRGDTIANAIHALLRNDYPNFSLIIVDQSETPTTELAVRPFLNNSRIQYIRSKTKGVSQGRNLGIRHAKSEWIAVTDDDGVPSPNWLSTLMQAFTVDPNIGVVYGNALPCSFNKEGGFVTSYVRTKPFLARSIRDKHQVEGISVCMGLRKSVWERIGGFDPMLGIGAPLKAATDMDFTIRTLLAGYFVYETPLISVTHDAFRPWKEAEVVIHNYLFGIGATYIKHLKCGNWAMLQVFWRLILRWTFSRPVVNIGIRSYKILRLTSFIQGFFTGWRIPIDKTKNRYRYLEEGCPNEDRMIEKAPEI